jgi:malonyl-CoA O-methyltransferase
LLAADAGALPFSPQSIGLLWSNLMLHWLDDPLPVFREAHRLLDVGAADVLDLRTGHLEGTARQFSDGYVHTSASPTCMTTATCLSNAAFADPVMDAELLTMTYASFDDLLTDLRRSGSTCAMQARRHGLTGRAADLGGGTRGLRAARRAMVACRRRWKWFTDTPGKGSRKKRPTGEQSSASTRSSGCAE